MSLGLFFGCFFFFLCRILVGGGVLGFCFGFFYYCFA